MATAEVIQDTRGTWLNARDGFDAVRGRFRPTVDDGDLGRIAARWWANLPWRKLLGDYLDGRHELRFVTERLGPEFRDTFAATLLSLRANLCGAVVDILANPARVASWGGEAQDAAAREVGLPEVLPIIVRETLAQGDGFALAWPDGNGQIVPWAWQAAEVIPHPSRTDPRRLDWAAHIWAQRKSLRLDLYGLDRVTRWVLPSWTEASTKPGQGWEPFEDDQPAEITYATVGLTPGVCPVVWLKARPDADPGAGGRSVLVDAIPVQDGLNRDLVAMMIATEQAVFPGGVLLKVESALANKRLADNPYMSGLTDQQRAALEGATKAVEKFRPAHQRIYATSAEGPYQPFPTPPVDAIAALQRTWSSIMCEVVGVPTFDLTQLGADVPSGDALHTLQTRFVAQVTRFEEANAGALRGLAALCGVTDPDIVWGPVVKPSQAEIDTRLLTLTQAGVGLEDALRLCGYADATEIAGRAPARTSLF